MAIRHIRFKLSNLLNYLLKHVLTVKYSVLIWQLSFRYIKCGVKIFFYDNYELFNIWCDAIKQIRCNYQKYQITHLYSIVNIYIYQLVRHNLTYLTNNIYCLDFLKVSIYMSYWQIRYNCQIYQITTIYLTFLINFVKLVKLRSDIW